MKKVKKNKNGNSNTSMNLPYRKNFVIENIKNNIGNYLENIKELPYKVIDPINHINKYLEENVVSDKAKYYMSTPLLDILKNNNVIIKENNNNNNNNNNEFKCGGMKRVPRKKAFWGTLVTAIAGLGAGVAKTIINSNEQKKQMQFELDKQKLLADEQNATRQTQADTEFYNNINANSGVYSDLHKGLKAKYGKRVRRKKDSGGFEWTGDDTGDVISSLLNIGTDLSTTAIQNNMNDNIRQTMLVTGQIGPNHNAINPNFNNLKNNNQSAQPIDETAIQYNTNLQNRKAKRLNSWYLR